MTKQANMTQTTKNKTTHEKKQLMKEKQNDR